MSHEQENQVLSTALKGDGVFWYEYPRAGSHLVEGDDIFVGWHHDSCIRKLTQIYKRDMCRREQERWVVVAGPLTLVELLECVYPYQGIEHTRISSRYGSWHHTISPIKMVLSGWGNQSNCQGRKFAWLLFYGFNNRELGPKIKSKPYHTQIVMQPYVRLSFFTLCQLQPVLIPPTTMDLIPYRKTSS